MNLDGSLISGTVKGSQPTYSKTSRSRATPTGYVISMKAKNAGTIAERLTMNGIKVYKLKAGTVVKAKQYSGKRTKAKLSKAKSVTFGSGAYFIPMNQTSRMIIAASLEPDNNDNYSEITTTLAYKMNISDLYRVETSNPMSQYKSSIEGQVGE